MVAIVVVGDAPISTVILEHVLGGGCSEVCRVKVRARVQGITQATRSTRSTDRGCLFFFFVDIYWHEMGTSVGRTLLHAHTHTLDVLGI